ncbi:MAG: hypothetical protein ACR2OZ_14730 [Verrucomicrobiales bacterium]
MNELTRIQRRVFEFVRDKIASGDPAPTPREIAAKFGWSSKRAAECHITARNLLFQTDRSLAAGRPGLGGCESRSARVHQDLAEYVQCA